MLTGVHNKCTLRQLPRHKTIDVSWDIVCFVLGEFFSTSETVFLNSVFKIRRQGIIPVRLPVSTSTGQGKNDFPSPRLRLRICGLAGEVLTFRPACSPLRRACPYALYLSAKRIDQYLQWQFSPSNFHKTFSVSSYPGENLPTRSSYGINYAVIASNDSMSKEKSERI